LNFLLHHHLAARDLGSPAAAAGAMLPDLWRMADRRVFAKSADASGEDATVRDVLAGIEHHAEIDRWFHGAPVFKDGERATLDALRNASNARRLGLFAHIAWELCLDGALVRHVGFANVQRALGEAIAAMRPDAHRRAAELHHFARVERTADERGLFERRMDRILDELLRGPWIDGYQTGAGIAERLEAVRARLRFGEFTHDERAAVAAGLDRLAERADASVMILIRRIE
jgi:hypothetical protein